MKYQIQFTFIALFVLLIKEFSCIPIFSDEESLKSIVISEFDLPTESSFLPEKENIEENEKSESFVELYEKYDEQFNKNSTSHVNEDDETPLKKRSSISEEEVADAEENSRSIIEKIQTIIDPEVRKEFEIDLNNNGQIVVSESEGDAGTDYNPNYANKVVIINGKPQENNADDEMNSVQSNFQELKVNDVGRSDIILEELITIPPSSVLRDTGFIEVFEEVFHPTEEKNDDVKNNNNELLNVQVVFDPIQIITENPYYSRNFESEMTTVKFEEDFAETTTETTESPKPAVTASVYDELVYDTGSPTGISGKSITDPNFNDETVNYGRSSDDIDATNTEVSTNLYEEEPTTMPAFIKAVTETVEVNTEISVSFHIDHQNNEEKKSNTHNEVKQSSTSDKSSEESKSSKSDEKKDKNKSSSASSEENSAKEILDKYDLRILDLPNTSNQARLMDDLYKDTLLHDIKKKDHPIVVLEVSDPTTQKKFIEKNEFAPHLEEKITPVEGKTFDVTTTVIYETLEDVITTVADGIELSKELRASVESFRSFNDESKTILDTNNEAVSSKNIKNALVNIAEEMTLENHNESADLSYIVIPIVVIGLLVALITICVVINRTFSRMSLL